MNPRSAKQFSKMRKKSKNHIIKNALQVFTEHRYHKTLIEIIEKTARITNGLIYNYFKSKDELLEAAPKNYISTLCCLQINKIKK